MNLSSAEKIKKIKKSLEKTPTKVADPQTVTDATDATPLSQFDKVMQFIAEFLTK